MKVVFGHKGIIEQDYMKRRRSDKRRQEENQEQGKEEEQNHRPNAIYSASQFLGRYFLILARNWACLSFLESQLDCAPTLEISRA